MVVAGMYSSIFIPEIEFEVPKVPKGMVTTVQGMMETFRDDLEMNQEERKAIDIDLYSKLQAVIDKIKLLESCDDSVLPFHIIVNDPSGNSFISNPFAPLIDVNLKEEHYVRTKEQMYEMGFVSDKEMAENPELKENFQKMEADRQAFEDKLKKVKNYKYTDKDTQALMKKMQGVDKKKDAHKLDYSKTVQEQELDSRLTIIEVECYSCGKKGELKTVTCEIPFFKEIVLMAFNCDQCGYRNTDVKICGQISEKAKRITLYATTREDMDRDIFKSDTATVKIKELDFEMSPGTLGSFYTTVEGILLKILEDIKENNPFVGDSSSPEQTKKFNEFLDRLEKMRNGEILPFTLEIDDPLDNCFILNPFYPKEDPNVLIEEYERTDEQKEELGLDQMKV